MKLYISSDMEGVAGVTAWQQVDARTPHPEYHMYKQHYTREVAAAVRGAQRSGASDVTINDSHGPMRNFVFEELPRDVRVIFGNRKPYSMVQDCDGGYAGAFFIGYHGGIGDADAVLCHTYTPSVIYETRLNGMICSEATLNAAVLGYHGVPLLYVTGDRTTVDGVQRQMPWVRGTIVKESIGNFGANTMSPAAAQRAIEEAAAAAFAARADAEPFIIESPIALEITLAKVEQADYVAMIPGFDRTGPRAVRFVDEDMLTIFKAFVAVFRLGMIA